MKFELKLTENPSTRCPVVLLLDTSYSMSGRPIKELHEGVCAFINTLKDDAIARSSVELSVITFGQSVQEMISFEEIQKINAPEQIAACGNTPMGQALEKGLHCIEKRRQVYLENGISSYKPWLVLMSDGMPTDQWQQAAESAKDMSNKGKLLFLGVGIGDNIDMNTYSQILPDNCPPKKLKGLNFADFFAWLSDSMSQVSRSCGERVSLQPTDSWSSIDPF